MTTGYQINGTDTDDLFVRKDLFSEGGLWVCGAGGNGTLGTNDTTARSSPVQTVAGGTNWKQVDKSNSHNGAIKTDGTLWLWGENTNGELGTNERANKSSPVQTIAGGTNWKQVSIGGNYTTAIKTDGTLWVWGSNTVGELGTNDVAVHRSSPVQTVAGGTNWKQVSVGSGHTTAIKTDRTLWVWGSGANGKLGTDDTVHRSSPVQTIAGGTNWKQVSVGTSHTTAIKTDGTLWTWGSGSNGRLGTNDTVTRSSPVQTIAGGTNWKYVNGGGVNSTMTAAIKTDGTLWVWGDYRGGSAEPGQLGTNDLEPRSSPVQTIAGGTNWKQVVAGDGQVQAIKTDGTLWVWGSGGGGRLGQNDTVHRSSPVQVGVDTDWKTVGGSSGLRAIREDYWE